MEIRSLRYFLAVCQEGNLTAAARSLYITQPALSHQVAELERQLGTRLFERRSRSMVLTPDGERLRSRAIDIVRMVEQTEDEFAHADGDDIAGTIGIIGEEAMSFREVARVAGHVHRSHPRITFVLTTGAGPNPMADLDEGLAELATMIRPSRTSTYHALHIPGKDRWGVVASEDSPLATLEGASPEDVLPHPAIVPTQAMDRSLTTNDFIAWFGARFNELEVIATTDLTRNAASFVRQGIGILYTVEGLADTSEGSGVRFVPLYPALETSSDLVWRRDRKLSPAAEAFVAEARRLWAQD